MNMKKSLIIILIIFTFCLAFSTSSCVVRNTPLNTPPTIELRIFDGPEYKTGFCVYRVEAVVTGFPKPKVSFTKDDSRGSAGEYKCQVNLESPQEPYLLEATATNSSGEVISQLLLEWGCEQEFEEYSETEQEPVVEEEETSYFDTLEERVFFKGDSEENHIFPDSWYKDEINPKGESLKPEEIERSMEIVIRALKKYPEVILENNLKKIYVLNYLEFYGVPYGGTNKAGLGVVYMINRGVENNYSDFSIEKRFHSEFSSILLMRYPEKINHSKFREYNPADFEYAYEGDQYKAIKEGKASKIFNPNLHEIGFLHTFAQSAFENDFNSIAEYLFMSDKTFWEIYEEYPLIKAKTDLVIEFYNSLDETFTKEYFLKFIEEN